MRPHHFFTFLCFTGILFLAVSCDSRKVFEENKKIPEGIWHVNDPVSFEVEITDTGAPVNFYLNVRNAGMYPFRNLFMFISITFPDGKVHRDTVECLLADNNGWLGSGLGDIWDNQILYRRGVRFPLKGKYIFDLEQAQRTGDKAFIENLPFILDVGLRIERQEN